jgi:fluoride ion exporter CrcB/FEX
MSVSRIEEDPVVLEQEREDREYVMNFWTVYDDIIFLSLFTQIGILCRLGMANWFKIFDKVFHSQSALFTNLPLNCCSCFLMGILCSGESLMQIIGTRFTPQRLQQDLHREADYEDDMLSHVDDNDLEEGEMEISTSTENPDSGHDERRRRRNQRHQWSTGRRRRRAPTSRITSWHPKTESFQNELREVQLFALERRIRMSPCLLLFPVKKEDVDVVENYFNSGYQKRQNGGGAQEFATPNRFSSAEQDTSLQMGSPTGRSVGFMQQTCLSPDDHDLSLEEHDESSVGAVNLRLSFDSASVDRDVPPDEKFQDEIRVENAKDSSQGESKASPRAKKDKPPHQGDMISTESTVSSVVGQSYPRRRTVLNARRQYGQINNRADIDYGAQEHPDLDQIINNVATNVSQKISRIRRVRLVDGWDVGTTPEEKSEDIMLGLRDGLCGALSSFSSWISSMVSLIRAGNIGQAFMGLVLGIQLPIVAYRFGQHVAVYIFIWRCRRETKQDDRRGYGIRLNTDEDNLEPGEDVVEASVHSMSPGDPLAQSPSTRRRRPVTVDEDDSKTPSVRAIITALFIMALVAQTTSLNFFYEPEHRLIALSLLFSPVGVLTRWRLSKLNNWRPSFPIGTFACNIGACALSGSLGTVLAGNPGPRERIALVALIAGFGGTLSSVAGFIVEVLARIDPILFQIDGVYYAVCSVCWGLLVSFLFTASVDWADSVE